MDLNKLISNASDEEKSSFAAQSQSEPLMKRNSQPRLSSIHSLMNDNATVSTAVASPHILSSPATTKPVELPSDIESPSLLEQKMAAPLPSDSFGIQGIQVGDSKKSSSDDAKEPNMQPLNSSQFESGTILVKGNSGLLTTDQDVASDCKPPLLVSAQLHDKYAHAPESNSINDAEINEEIQKKNENLVKAPESNKLHEQIQKLESLKQKEEVDIIPSDGKPKRYRTKPIWAQDYIPTINRTNTDGSDGIRSVKSDLSLNGISKLDIPSLTGYIPRNDFNKLVTEWIWANIEGVKQDYSDIPSVEEHIEVELKFGNIWDKVKDCRIQLPINTECIVATDYVNQECFFKSGITLESYNNTKTYMTKIMQEALEQQKQGRSHASNKFVVENSHVVDLIASDARRNDKPISGRVSLDIKTKRKTNSISKQRISDLFLHFPNTLFDLRLSMSLELPNELNDAAFEVFKKRVSKEREKERTSYIHQATATRVDLTKVREKNNRVPKYELELEINTPALLRSMRNVTDDPLYYIDLVQAFIDNGRIITRQLSNQQK